MQTYPAPLSSIRAVSGIALLFGLLGAGFYWWTPLGMVLSLTGLMLGVIGWVFAHRHSARRGPGGRGGHHWRRGLGLQLRHRQSRPGDD